MRRGSQLAIEPLESRHLLAVAIFQQGLNNYAGQSDTVLYSREPGVNFGTEGSISPDQQDANGVRQGLLRFGDIIGNLPGQIPLGATINSATLTVNVVNDSNSAMQMSLYRMQQDWGESTATWNSFGAIPGVQASEGEASNLPPDSILFDPDTTANSPTAGIFDVKTTLEYWVGGVPNYGWLIESAATNGWDFRTKESAQSQRPTLHVEYDMPASTADFQILNTSVTQAEGNSGTTTAIIEVSRLGDVSGAASINYTVAAGGPNPADPGDFTAVGTPTALPFGAGEAYAIIEVAIAGDTTLEGLETILITLSGGDVVVGRDVATVTIADDDALINEVLANVSNADDETDREYVELIGTPNQSLTGYYFVVFEGEEEENGGTGSGRADLVVDLTGQSFGSNGLFVITGNNWEYQGLKDLATNQMMVAAFDQAGGILEDSSQTYALIRSPINPIVQGTDYDTVGAYENATNQAIGTGVGILDQLPAGAQVVDSVGVVEGGGGDRDRVATTEELGHPGIHVHQPTGFVDGNVTSDAVSRRYDPTQSGLPNSIGVWFNGDIGDGNPAGAPIEYLNDTFFISVVAPDGAVLTPGSHNILRNVFFSVSDQNKQVAEAAGSVTLRIERTGDIVNEEIEVTYQTVDIGSAMEDVDYTGVVDTVTLGQGVDHVDIMIPITSFDGVAEGFERFRVDIISVSNPSYLITNGQPTGAGVNPGQATVTIADADVLIRTFQNGVNGYAGTTDAYLDGELIFDKFGQDPVIRVDQVKGEGEQALDAVRPQQGLIRFADMFGVDPLNQVPMGSKIFDAFLTLNVTNTASGADIRFFRMLQDWEQVNTTWFDPQGNAGSSILNGVTPDNVEATAVPDARVPDALAGQSGLVQIPLNADTIQSWANGSLPNFGWSIVSDAGSLWSFNSSEAFLFGTFKPELTILYTEPEVVKGTFSFSVDNYSVNEAGGTATITVNRIGGSDGTATLNWEVTPGSGDLSDITGASTGSITFAAGEWFKTFNVAINNDIALERNETLNLTLTSADPLVEFGRSSAVLTIRDNDFLSSGADLLLNELWINSPGNDPPHEFVELLGDAGIGLGSLYYVAIEGLIGDHEGTAEKVVDLGAYFNGSNGLSLLTPDAADFAFRVPAGTTQIDLLGSIGTENVASQNDSTTYMLLYSPLTDLTQTAFDYDWDNDGGLELPGGVFIIDSVGVRVLGAEDQLYGPSTNEVEFALSDPDVDAISRIRGNTQVNRGSAWYGGDLFPAGDDYLLYETAEAFFLPVTGTAMTPGELNTGNAAQSPLVALTDVTINPDGTATATFSGPISQVLSGDGGSESPGGTGVTITDANGDPLGTVDLRPSVGGLGTNTLTIMFTGSYGGGQLPAGSYKLNFVGNGIIANGRAVDVENNGTQIDGFYEFEFTVSAPVLYGDYNNNGVVDAADYVLFRKYQGTTTPLVNDNIGGQIGPAHYEQWTANFGGTSSPGAGSERISGALANSASSAEIAVAEKPADITQPITRGANTYAFSSRPSLPQPIAARRLAARTAAAPSFRDDALLGWLSARQALRSRFEAETVESRDEEMTSADGGDSIEALDGAFEQIGV